ncbi:MAG: SCO6745 family protein [Acidimicrobiales bacterium]
MLDDHALGQRTRRLASAIEPLAGQVYFSPECHAAYVDLGFGPSRGSVGSVAFPDGPAYFTSRGSILGQVPGEVVAAAFAVFNPAAVIPSVAHGWSLTDATTICEARTAGAVAQLVRILGVHPEGIGVAGTLLARAGEGLGPEGKPLFAGLTALGLPGEPVADLWRLADRLREYRGDAHTAAWTAAGLDAIEIGLLSEAYWGLPMRSYARTRAWTDADFDGAEARLVERGLIAAGSLTEAGRSVREEIETATDRQCRPMVEALGDDLDALLQVLRPWGRAIRDAGGYPESGPHDLADAGRSR